MTPSQLEFNLAVREWANEERYAIIPSGDDNKLTIKYCNRADQAIFDEQIEEMNRDISSKIRALAERHDADIELEFTDLGFGELGVIVYIKDPPNRGAAQEEYYDLLYLGPRRSDEQYLRLQILIKKYGFR